MYSRVLRFAPSPNGYLHLGHAYSALLNSDMARELGGRLWLRIEDIDTERCRPEYEQAMYEDLCWLGMHWQDPVRRQSEHFSDYEMAIGRLEADGLLYPSFESRRELAALTAELDRHGGWPRDPDGVPIYPGRARKLSAAERRRRRDAGEPFALRLAMDKAVARAGVLTWTETGSGPQGETDLITAAPQMWGDVILAGKETPASYHLAAVVDDALQGVTDVVRGQDLFWLLTFSIRNTLLFGIVVAVLSRLLALLIGLVAGYSGGWVDRILMSVNDTFIVIPLFPILVLFYFVLRDHMSWGLLALMMACLGWSYDARLIRSVAMSLRSREFTETGIFSGMSTRQILVEEHLPYVLPIVFSTTMNNINWSIGLEVTLSVLGFTDINTPTIGVMIYWANQHTALVAGIWWWIFFPVLLVVMTFIGLFLLAVSMNEHIDPRSRLGRSER
jgi:peptide/nickel transport system permease protein